MNMNPLYGILKNTQGGWKVKTPLSQEQQTVFKVRGSGLYAWCTESQYRLMVKGKLSPIKFGQFGTNALLGTTPQETIDSYAWIPGEAIVILWVLHFSDVELSIGSPYEIEQRVNKRIGERIVDGSGLETFKTSLDIIKKEVSKELYNDGSRVQNFLPRKRQEEFIEKFIKHRINGGTQFLLGAIMRYGKNFAWLTANYRLLQMGFLKKGSVLMVLTAKPNVFATLKTDIESHIYFKDFRYIKLKDYNDMKDVKLESDKVNVIAVSTQLAYNLKRKPTVEFLKTLNIEDVFVDECHSGTNTEKFNTLISELKINHRTFVSGTPYKTAISRGFSDDDSYYFGYVEQQIDKMEDIKNGFLNDSITLKTYLPSIADKFKTNPNYTDEEQYSLTKHLSVNEDGSFIFGGDVREFISDILGKSNNKSKFSPFRFCEGMMNHTVWLLPDSVAVAKGVGRLIEEIAPEYKVIVASGDETKDIEVVHNAILSNDKTITLTIGRFVEGTTVKHWTACLVLSDTKSFEKYFQFIFRVASPSDGKDVGYVFDFSPERAFKMVFEMANGQARNENRTDSQQVVKEWLDCNNVYRMGDGPQPKLVEIGDVLEQVRNGDYRAASLIKTHRDWINTENINEGIVGKFIGLNTYKKQEFKTVMNENDIDGGKNYKIKGLERTLTKKEKDELTKVLKNITGIIAPLPLLATIYEESTLEGILKNVDNDCIEEVCGVGGNVIQLLIDMEIIDVRRINYFL